MKFKKDEQNILKFLKFSAPVVTVLFSCLVIGLIYILNQYSFKSDLENMKQEFEQENKSRISDEVKRAYTLIEHHQNNTEALIRKSIQENVTIAENIVSTIYRRNKDESLFKKQQFVKQTLQDVRFNSNIGYFFIISKQGKMIFHPYLPELENKNILSMQDPNGTYLFKEMIALMNEKQGAFYDWYWYKQNIKQTKYKKVGYLKNIASSDWFIGSGYYVDEFETLVQKELFNYISTIEFATDGHIFILDFQGNILAHKDPLKIGKNILNNQDKKGNFYVQEMIEQAKKEEGFVSYEDKNSSFEQISFVKAVHKWDFLLVSSFNEGKLQETIEAKKEQLLKAHREFITNMLIISFFTIIILTFIAIYVSQIIQSMFVKYKKRIEQEIEKNKEKDMLLAQQSKMNALGEMIGNIAHQWRQPLSTITTASSGIMLKHEFNDLNNNDFVEFTKIIDENAKYLSHTIEDFKEFFNQNETKQIINLQKTVDKTINLISSQFISKQIHIITHIDETIELNIVENELMQVLINILNNARDFLCERNIENKLILIDAYIKKHHIVIEIKDNALGMKEEVLQRVFEPYFTTKFKSKGIGVGLYMCYEIITKHFSGTIEAQNSNFVYGNHKYCGANFIIKIPLSKK
jgi:signal transduction histidine kinase